MALVTPGFGIRFKPPGWETLSESRFLHHLTVLDGFSIHRIPSRRQEKEIISLICGLFFNCLEIYKCNYYRED